MAKKYVDVEEILKHKRKMQGFGLSSDEDFWDFAVLVEDINNTPAADVEPVVHARWDTIEKEGFWIGQMEESLLTGRPTKCSLPVCSHCKTEFGTIALGYKRCPECGAIMDK